MPQFIRHALVQPWKPERLQPRAWRINCYKFGHRVKIAVILVCAVLVAIAFWFANQYLAPLVFDSRIERIAENNLPRIVIERGGIVYCRMKADDFRFPLPPSSKATNAVVSGVFDSVDGSVEVHFDGTDGPTAGQYEAWVAGKLQRGGRVTAEAIPQGLLIKFHYFGDR